MMRTTLLALAALLLLGGPAMAQAPEQPPAPRSQPQPGPSPGADRSTTHTLALPGHDLSFTATVSTIRLANPAGAVQAEIVTTAFQLAGAAPGTTRPVTFAVNGGPGASSAWLNLGAIGPWRVPVGGANGVALPSSRPVAVDNMDTWLDFTDLVFLDPPGTGFSRVTGG
ncbi:MAG: S10 family serine carboxypeptidase-like protein, partial [Janthinobacterium lividum]